MAPQTQVDWVENLEAILGESFPQQLLSLFNTYDGEQGEGRGAFLGHAVMSVQDVQRALEFAKSQMKPANPKVPDPKKADALIQKMVRPVVDHLPLPKRLFFNKPKWHKVEFEGSPTSMGGPYLYKSEETTRKERQRVKLSTDAFEEVMVYLKSLHELEAEAFNWDEIDVAVYRNGRIHANRKFFDFNASLPLTSTPEGAIRKQYFHLKWVPVLSDYGGNYIGVDLDPGETGTKGQVIVFGRDEEDMFVLANSWGEFLAFVIKKIEGGGEEFKGDDHLHDLFRKMMLG